MFVSKINLLKGKTIEKSGKWERIDYSIEITLAEKDNPESAKEMANLLIDAWLKEGETVQKTVQKDAKPSKKICEYSGCNKEIDGTKYRYCYTHFQKIRRKA